MQIGRYQVLDKIGHGGMGSVYLAQDDYLDRQVAIKVARNQTDDPDKAAWLRARFLQEARLAAKLAHSHIVTIYDMGEFQDGAYLVMDFIPGGSLDRLARQAPLPLENLLRILEQIASALDFAHSQGVIHRDVKPLNVLIDDDGTAKLTDFGIAKQIDSPLKTTTDILLGTRDFISPEQVMGKTIDGRVDQYSLAAMTFFLLAQRPVFLADNDATALYSICHEPPPRLSSLAPKIPSSVDAVVAKALAKRPADRYATCSDFVQALRRAFQRPHESVLTETLSVADVPMPEFRMAAAVESKAPRRIPLPVAVVTTAFVLVFAGGLYVKIHMDRRVRDVVPTEAVGSQALGSIPAGIPQSAGRDKDKSGQPALTRPDQGSPAEPHKSKKDRKKTDQPAEKLAIPSPKPYSGPKEGTLVWTGALHPDEQVKVSNGVASSGRINGSLPAVPVSLSPTPDSVKLIDLPAPGNSFRSFAFTNDGTPRSYVLFKWKIDQSKIN